MIFCKPIEEIFYKLDNGGNSLFILAYTGYVFLISNSSKNGLLSLQQQKYVNPLSHNYIEDLYEIL